MSSKIVAYNLSLDTIDRTAQDVINANPGMFTGTIYAPASAYVPVYLYTSLGTLWMGASSSPSVFQERIGVDLGTGSSDPRGSITVITDKITESARQPRYGFDSDQPGASEADITIYMSKPKVNQDPTFILNASFRVSWLLDNTIRQLRGIPPDLLIPQDPIGPYFDNTIVSNEYYKCFFEDYDIPVSAQTQVIKFGSSYIRVLGR